MKFLKWILLFYPCVLFAQNNDDQIPYSKGESIEITLNNITTIIYRDKLNPMTDFWYIPGELRIERKKEGGRSKLNFSMEIKRNSRKDVAPFHINVQLVINSTYSTHYLDEIKRKLVELGYSATDPLGAESYKLINLRPISAEVEHISFDELFSTAEWLNQNYIKKKKATLDKPFPIHLKLSHDDATILLESLVQERIWRVARVNYGEGQHIPVYLNLAFSEVEQPFEYLVLHEEGKDKVIFSNKTEHHIYIERLLYYSNEKNKWVNKTINKTLQPYTLEMKNPDSFEIKVEKIGSQKKILWHAQYNYENALKFYLKNDLPSSHTTLSFSIGALSENGFFKKGIQHLSLAYQIVDEFGFVHSGGDVLSVSELIGSQLYTKKITIPSFGKIKSLKYRVALKIPGSSTEYNSHWIKIDEDNLSSDQYVSLENVLGCLLVQEQNKSSDKEFYSLEDAYILTENESSIVYLIPKKLNISKTPDGVEKVELRYIDGKLLGFVQLFPPIYPNTVSYLRSLYGNNKRFNFAKLTSAEIDFEIEGVKIFNNVNIFPVNNGQLRLHFRLIGKEADIVYNKLNSNTFDQLFIAKMKWVTGDGTTYQTIYTQSPFSRKSN